MPGFDVSSTVKMNLPQIEKLTASAQKALDITNAALLSEVKNAEVFPFDTGNLQNESTFPDNTGSEQGTVRLISDTVYGRRLYYHPEYNFNHKHNANAQGLWYRPWLEGGQRDEFVPETFARIYKELNNL